MIVYVTLKDGEREFTGVKQGGIKLDSSGALLLLTDSDGEGHIFATGVWQEVEIQKES